MKKIKKSARIQGIGKKEGKILNLETRRNKIEVYLQNLEREISRMDTVVEQATEGVPAEMENSIRKVIKEEFKGKKFSGFIAQDLFQAYIEGGGRSIISKLIKQDKKNVLKVLQMIIDIGKETNGESPIGNATQVIVNIQGLPAVEAVK